MCIYIYVIISNSSCNFVASKIKLVIFINDLIVGCKFVVRGCVCLCCYLLLRFYFAPWCRPWGKIGIYSPPTPHSHSPSSRTLLEIKMASVLDLRACGKLTLELETRGQEKPNRKQKLHSRHPPVFTGTRLYFQKN